MKKGTMSEKTWMIREIQQTDTEELFSLLNSLDEQTKSFFHPHPFDFTTIREICKGKQDHYFVMVVGKKIMGYSFLRLFGYKVPSFGIIIKNEFSGKGYGTILTQWTVEKAKALGYEKVILKTYKENLRAKRIYEKIGFKTVGVTEDNRQFLMELNL
jgi:RimJ/RimL family protein N-acetyltransferase